MACVGVAVVGGMTEAAVGSLLSKLCQEAYRIHAFVGDVKALKRQLTIIQGFVQSVYYNNSRMEGYVLEWVEKVEDCVSQAERILNDCSWWHPCDGSASSSSRLNKVLKCPENVRSKWRNSRRISRISEKLRVMEKLAIQNGLKGPCDEHPPPPSEESEVKTGSTLYEESFTVGLDEKLSQFLPLMDAHPRIGVVGMGGIGKTRLLKHVFKHIKSNYDLRIWLCISQVYDIKSFQMDILHEVLDDKSEIEALWRVTSARRAEKIHEALKVKNCLIVLDDVWSSDPSRLEGSLPENDLLKALGLPENVKMLVSTRRCQVVTDLKAYHYQMQHLSTEESKKLFCLYAFGSADFHEPQQDRLLKIIERCHNLPLALKTTARVLGLQYQGNPARFPLPEEEADDCGHLFGNKDLDPVMRCLKRSYNVLPMDLKRCFAYMAVFPEDHEIDGSKLVKLWMAEELVLSPEHGRSVLRQLYDRCLLEVVSPELDDWYTPIKYKMHDLVHHLAISIFHRVGGFCQGSVDEFRRALMCKRRVSGGGINDEFTCDAGGSQLCSLFLYNRQCIAKSFWKTVDNLRVLDTHDSSVPCSGKVLKHLVYLHLKQRDPLHWLKDARSLEYLHIESVERLPDCIGDLSRLTYFELSVYWNDFYVSAQESLGRLANLRELKKVKIDHGFTFRHLSKLQKLIELRCGTELPLASVEEWTPPPSMQGLWFANQGLGERYNMPESWKVMTNIQCLRLQRVSLTSGCRAFQKLVQLVLEDCSGNPPIEIANLPSLTTLRLRNFGSCSELPEEYGMSWAFPCLEHFVIAEFTLLSQLPTLRNGAMRSMITLLVFDCPIFNFNELPVELSSRSLSSEPVRGGWMWLFKTNLPLPRGSLDCGMLDCPHSFRGVCHITSVSFYASRAMRRILR